MVNLRRASILLIAAAFAVPAIVAAAPQNSGTNGIFQGSTDIGVTQKGSSLYDPATESYRVTGGGEDMWASADSFHMDWVKLSGDATLAADIHFEPGDWHPRAKAVLIFRQSLDPSSAYADLALHHDGHIAIQERATYAGPTTDATATVHNSVRLRIERKGDTFTAYAEDANGKMVTSGSVTVAMHGPVYVGIGVCAHNADALRTATFSNIKIEQPRQLTTAAK